MSIDRRLRPRLSDVQELKSEFSQHIGRAEQDVEDFQQRRLEGVQENAVTYCLRHAIDLSKGCLLSVDANLPDSSATLGRAILETLFWARYVTLSKENAQEFADSMVNELKRLARKNLKAGLASITDAATDQDRSEEILNSSLLKDVPRGSSIESVAKAGGLGHIYTMIYGFESMIAHGKALGLENTLHSEDRFFSVLSAAFGYFQCVELITLDWMEHRKVTSQELLQRVLGLRGV